MAFDSATDEDVHPLRVLFLGINAHINYDLVLCVADVMEDWNDLDEPRRGVRQTDYKLVDDVIRRTIDDVQSSVVTPVAPGLGLVDRLMGPIDEFLFSSLITGWRQDTWGDAISLLESARSETIRSTIESQALALSDRILTIGPN